MSEEKIEKDFWNSEGVQAHLTITQSIIQRMAVNSAAAKAWCIALVSAILFTVGNTQIGTGKPALALIALLPTLLFWFLDTYYLSLEKSFRKSYNGFIGKLHQRKIDVDDLYVIEPKGDFFWKAFVSVSTWPFYSVLVVVIFLAQIFLLK